MITILEFLLSIIYPNVCGFCGKLNEEYLCEECEKRISKDLVYRIKNINNMYFEHLIHIAKYSNEFREDLLRYKFYDNSYMYKTFSKIILKNKKICGIIRKL